MIGCLSGSDLHAAFIALILMLSLFLCRSRKQIIDVKCNYVKPKFCEKLSETAKNEFQLTEQLIEENGQYLENVLEEVKRFK